MWKSQALFHNFLGKLPLNMNLLFTCCFTSQAQGGQSPRGHPRARVERKSDPPPHKMSSEDASCQRIQVDWCADKGFYPSIPGRPCGPKWVLQPSKEGCAKRWALTKPQLLITGVFDKVPA